MKDKLRATILEVVRTNNGIHEIRLTMRVMGFFGPMAFATEEMSDVMKELLITGELFELHYTDPDSPTGRAKKLLFVKGTIFLNLEEINAQSRSLSSQANLAGTVNSDV